MLTTRPQRPPNHFSADRHLWIQAVRPTPRDTDVSLSDLPKLRTKDPEFASSYVADVVTYTTVAVNSGQASD